MKDIYEALKEGKTPDELAQAFADELNAAIKKRAADQAVEAEAARKAKDTQAVVDCINAYLATYYPQVQPIDAHFIEDTIKINVAADKIAKTVTEGQGDWESAMNSFFKAMGI